MSLHLDWEGGRGESPEQRQRVTTMNIWTRWLSRFAPKPAPAPPPRANYTRALALAQPAAPKQYSYPIQAPTLDARVIPKSVGQAAVAMDSASYGYAELSYGFGNIYGFSGFAGYPYLAALATRAEYRAIAAAISTELTREWISINSTDENGERVTQLNAEIKRVGLQKIIRRAAEHDSFYGIGQIFVDVDGVNPSTPLILSNKTIKAGAKVKLSTIEPMWTTPKAYNATLPWADDFYKPSSYFVLGNDVHASRLQRVITREVPDMLKPAFNFGGISLSQLAEPYVDNWLRTRQSVSDLINNFSITALKTDMAQMLDGGDDDPGLAAQNIVNRAEFFNLMRANKGLMLLNNGEADTAEDLVQLNTPLSGLHELMDQALRMVGMAAHMPEIILTGESPSGLGTSAEGPLRSWEDWVAASQEVWSPAVLFILQVLMLSLWGEIDETITFSWNPLRQMTRKELADIRLSDAQAAQIYIGNGSVLPEEDRERLARDPESGYQGLDLGVQIEDLDEGEDDDEE